MSGERVIVTITLTENDGKELYNRVKCLSSESWGARSSYLRSLIQIGFEVMKDGYEKSKARDLINDRKFIKLVTGMNDNIENIIKLLSDVDMAKPETKKKDCDSGGSVDSENGVSVQADDMPDKDWLDNTLKGLKVR
jgi:predicted DNA-binding protein